MKKIISILLTLVMVFAMGAVTVFASAAYSGNVTGSIKDVGVDITGTLSGDYDLTLTGTFTGLAGTIASFSGTVSGDISGAFSGKMNRNGDDTIFAQITGTGAADPVYLIGVFPPCGTTGYFEGKIVTGTLPIGVTDVTITTTEGVTTAPVGGTLHMQLSSPAGYEVRWGVLVDDRTAGYASIDANGTLHILQMPADGNITVMANTLDPNVYSENINITVTAPGTEVKANADASYMVVIPSSVNFGNIYRNTGVKTKDFSVSVENALVEAGSIITVEKTAGATIMKDQNGTGIVELPFALGLTSYVFTATQLTDGAQSITSSVSCDTANLQVAGLYSGFMTFAVTYN